MKLPAIMGVAIFAAIAVPAAPAVALKEAVERFQLLPKLSQYPRHGRIDAPKKMTLRNAPLEVEEVEQLALIDRLPTHHDPASAAESLNGTES
jgi:hypothetical protein